MNFVLAAGGTGGHMVPAHALAAELRSRGHGVLLITDERGARFPGLFENVPVHVLPAGRLGGGPIGWLKAIGAVARGRGEAKRLYRQHRPDAVVGFGGYPAFPSLLAASALDIPTVLHEQNAVLGRVNRLLAGEAEAIGTAYDEVDRLKSVLAPRKGPPPVPSELNTACPACTSPMKEVPVGKLHVDYCSQCKGIFLDRGELDAALELVKGAGGTMLSLIAAAISEAPIDIDVG